MPLSCPGRQEVVTAGERSAAADRPLLSSRGRSMDSAFATADAAVGGTVARSPLSCFDATATLGRDDSVAETVDAPRTPPVRLRSPLPCLRRWFTCDDELAESAAAKAKSSCKRHGILQAGRSGQRLHQPAAIARATSRKPGMCGPKKPRSHGGRDDLATTR